MPEAKKPKQANGLKDLSRLYKEFGFMAGMSKGALAQVGNMK